MHSLNLRNLFLFHSSLINNFVRVLILVNLDVLGLLSWVMGFVSLRDLLDDPGRLHLDFVDDVFVHGVRQLLSVDLRFHEPAPLPCTITSVCQLLPEGSVLCRVVVSRV